MKWIKDTTGRFATRPHYQPAELDSECELIIEGYLKDRHGKIEYPVSTEDLLFMLEKVAGSVDVYVDFADEEIWGKTTFSRGRKPVVQISKLLSSDERYENPFRSTITHEFFHVRFHGFLYDDRDRQSQLTGIGAPVTMPSVCHRTQIQLPNDYDWMEWQAGFGSGALLMPKAVLTRHLIEVRMRWGFRTQIIRLDSLEGQIFIGAVTEAFKVSEDAARVRLTQLGYILDDRQSKSA